MAALDKMYIKDWTDFCDLREWFIAFYPERIGCFYNLWLSYSEFQSRYENIKANSRTGIKQFYDTYIKPYKTLDLAAHAYVDGRHFFINSNNATYMDNIKGAKDIILEMKNKYDNLEQYLDENVSIAVTSTSFETDKILLWRCPLAFVREYLETNCGYKTKWYHKLFFKEVKR